MSDFQYFFAVDNQQRGPNTAAELIAMQLAPATLVWREGLANWQRLDSITELIELMQPSAPAQPTAPSPSPNIPLPVPPQFATPPYATPIGYTNAPPRDSSKKITAGIFGILFGGLGIHKFILGYTGAGLTMLLVTILTCGWGGLIFHTIGFIEGIIYLCKTDEEFYQTYVVNRREWF